MWRQTAVMQKVIYVQASCKWVGVGNTGSYDREVTCQRMARPSMWAKWGREQGGSALWGKNKSSRDEAITVQEAGSATMRSDNEHEHL